MDPLNQTSENSVQSAPANDEIPTDGTGKHNHTLTALPR